MYLQLGNDTEAESCNETDWWNSGGDVLSDGAFNSGDNSVDSATMVLGDGWGTPTEAQYDELLLECSHEFITRNGVHGCLFTSTSNGNTIFFPCSGAKRGTGIAGGNDEGLYATTSYHRATKEQEMIEMQWESENVYTDQGYAAYEGHTIRAVVVPTV